jgi:hypothetical protein
MFESNKKSVALILMSCLWLLSCDGKQNTPSSNSPQKAKSPNQSDYGRLIVGEWDCVTDPKEYGFVVSSTKYFGADGKFKSTNRLIGKASAGVSVTTGTYVVDGDELVQRSMDEYTKKMANYVYTIGLLTRHTLKLADKFGKNNCTK